MATPENLHIVDAISNLPSHVIDDILVRLPLRDAVRTSVLSKQWRYRWTYTPELVFYNKFYRRIRDTQPDSNDRINSCKQKLKRIVCQALLCHRGPINKFTLDAPDHQTSPDIDDWILFLSNYSVREFTLWLNYFGNKHVMPSHLFTFQHLTHLTLGGCVFKPPPQFKGFCRLVFLDFRFVEFEPEIFARFISQCLLLDTVLLSDSGNWDSIEVEGPNLKNFVFHGTFKSIRIKNAPLLAKVSLALRTREKSECQSSIKSLGFMPMLENLRLHPYALELLGAGVPYRYPDSFNSLTVLYLTMHFISVEEVACVLCIIRSSPNLQGLDVWATGIEICEAVPKFICAQETPDHYLNQLKWVEIRLYSVKEAQVEFIRYLLACAGELEDMVIKFEIRVPDDDLLNLLEQLPRASPTVVVHLIEDH